MRKEDSQAGVANPPTSTKGTSPQFSPEALAILEKADSAIFLPHKYFPVQRRVISEKVKEIHAATPTLPIRQVVVQILTELPDFLPPDNILDVTRQIVEQWQKLSEVPAPIH